jgi:tryptophan-rich sensory protein
MTLDDLTEKEIEMIGRMRAYKKVETEREKRLLYVLYAASFITILALTFTFHSGAMLLLALIPIIPAGIMVYTWDQRAAKIGKEFLNTVRKSY